jgi:hypothetical protein
VCAQAERTISHPRDGTRVDDRGAMRSRLLFVSLLLACSEHGQGGPPVTNIDGPPGGGGACGGFTNEQCAADEFCDFGRNTCGASDEQGTCQKRPTGCPDAIAADPVCGCDGQVHGSVCDANAVGIDVDASHRCPVPPGVFACGFRECNLGGAYCEVIGSDIGGEPDTFTCKGMPMCPGPATCGCLGNEPCGSNCSGDEQKGFVLVCLGG